MILLVLVLTLSFSSMLSADNFGKQNYAGANPFGLLIHYYSGDFGRIEQSARLLNFNFTSCSTKFIKLK